MISQQICRSRGGLTSKPHVATDARGNPLRVMLSVDRTADIEHAGSLIVGQSTLNISADIGYDPEAFVALIQTQGSEPVAPPGTNERSPRSFNKHLYKGSDVVEGFFSRIRQLRRIATPWQNFATSFV